MHSFKYEKLNVIDDRLVQHEPVVKMFRGAESSSRMVQTPIGGAVNQSQIQFNVNCTPSNYFDRKPMLKTTFIVPVTVTNNTGANIAGNADNTVKYCVPGTDVTMSAYPASNLFGLCDASINGAQVCSYDMGKYSSTLLKLSNVSKNMKKATCPSCPESSFAMLDEALYTLSNPQSNFNDSTSNYVGNGSWTFKDVTGNNIPAGNWAAGATAVVLFTIETYEPLILPPFIWNASDDNSEAIFGMNNLLVTLNINQQSSQRCCRILSRSVLQAGNNGVTLAFGGNNGQGGTGVYISGCELHYSTYRAPALIDFKLPSPLSIFHTYNFYNNFIVSPNAFQAGALATSSFDMRNIVSTGMPSLICLWCDKGGVYANNTAKYNYPITALKIDLGTNQSMLSNYDITDLFRLSEASGLEQSYLSYVGKAYVTKYSANGTPTANQLPTQLVGGTVVLRPGISFPLPSEVVTSSSGSFTWNFNVTCETINAIDIAAAVRPQLNVMMIYDTWVSIDTATLQCSVNKSMLSVPEVLGMSKSEAVTVDDIKAESGGALQSHDVVKSGGGFKASGKLASRVRK